MKNLEVSRETAKRWYNENNEELKKIAISLFPELIKETIPKKWEDLKEIKGWYVQSNCKISHGGVYIISELNKNTFATKEQAEASLALSQLSQLREVYRNDWEPNWAKIDKKYTLGFFNDKIEIIDTMHCNYYLSFQTKDIAKEFLENFKDLIEVAKPLLG